MPMNGSIQMTLACRPSHPRTQGLIQSFGVARYVEFRILAEVLPNPLATIDDSHLGSLTRRKQLCADQGTSVPTPMMERILKELGDEVHQVASRLRIVSEHPGDLIARSIDFRVLCYPGQRKGAFGFKLGRRAYEVQGLAYRCIEVHQTLEVADRQKASLQDSH